MGSQFTELTQLEVDRDLASAQRYRSAITSTVEQLNDKGGFSKFATVEDPLADVALTLLVSLMYPEMAEKIESGQLGVREAVSAITSSSNEFASLISACRSLEKQISDGQVTPEGHESRLRLAEQLEQRQYTVWRFRGGPYGQVMCQWMVNTVHYYGVMLQLPGRKANLALMKEEREETQRLIDEASAAVSDGGGRVSALQVKSV